MSSKTFKIIYWASTGLLTFLMLFSVANYFFNHEAIVNAFETLGYPVYLIYPLAIAKLLGLVAILTRKSSILKEWAYAGFFFDFILAFFAHIMVNDGDFAGALVAMIILFTSYFSEKKAFQS
ncbi:MAG: DoxX family protein [Balneola sp.]|nr:MAG: DoxX family protein [Balneola sp.]